jgi:hypothetical protein
MYGKDTMEHLEEAVMYAPKIVTKDEVGTVDGTLEERGNRYGKFSGHAKITQDIKHVIQSSKNWAFLSPSQRESLDMVAHKLGRILNGDPDYADSWHDIAGYASLIDKQLTGEDP